MTHPHSGDDSWWLFLFLRILFIRPRMVLRMSWDGRMSTCRPSDVLVALQVIPDVICLTGQSSTLKKKRKKTYHIPHKAVTILSYLKNCDYNTFFHPYSIMQIRWNQTAGTLRHSFSLVTKCLCWALRNSWIPLLPLSHGISLEEFSCVLNRITNFPLAGTAITWAFKIS